MHAVVRRRSLVVGFLLRVVLCSYLLRGVVDLCFYMDDCCFHTFIHFRSLLCCHKTLFILLCLRLFFLLNAKQHAHSGYWLMVIMSQPLFPCGTGGGRMGGLANHQ